MWLNDLEQSKKLYNIIIEKNEECSKNIHQKSSIFVNEVIPELKKFTNNLHITRNSIYSIEEIINFEKI